MENVTIRAVLYLQHKTAQKRMYNCLLILT